MKISIIVRNYLDSTLKAKMPLKKSYQIRANQGQTQDFKLGGDKQKKNQKNLNTYPYSIKKLPTKTNTQK